jgi:type IV pilus assembly protein PilO
MKKILHEVKSNRKLLSILVIFSILILGLLSDKFIYKPYHEYKTDLEQQISFLEDEYSVSSLIMDKKKDYVSGIEEAKLRLENTDNILPPEVTQEMLIFLINDIEKELGIYFSTLSFNELETIMSSNDDEEENDIDENNVGSKIDVNNININDLINNGENNSSGQADNSTTKISNLLNEKGVRMTIVTKTNITYNQLKDMLAYINRYPYKISINNLKINNAANKLDVNMELSMYGLESPMREYEPTILEGYSIGKDSIFTPIEGFGTTFNKGEKKVEKGLKDKHSDLFIRLVPITADPTTVTIGRTNDIERKSYIFADENSEENITIEFYMENKKYFLRYKTETSSYTYDYKGVEFNPETALEIQVLSTKRLSEDDKSGVNATLINKTNMPLSVILYNEDSKRPRFKIFEKQGNIIAK